MKSLPPYKSRLHQYESSPCKGSLSSSSLPSSLPSLLPSSLLTTSTSLQWNGLPTLYTDEKTQITIPKVTEKKKYIAVKKSDSSIIDEIREKVIKGIGIGKDKKIAENFMYKSSPIFSKLSKNDQLNSSIISTSSSHKMPGNGFSSSSSFSTGASSNSSYPTLSPALSPSFSPPSSSFTTSFPTSFSPSISPKKDTRPAVTRRDTKKHNKLSATATASVAAKNQPIINSNLPRPKFISELMKLSNHNQIIMKSNSKHEVLRRRSEPALIVPMEVEICDDNYMNNNQVKTKSQNAKTSKTKKVSVTKVTKQKKIKMKPTKEKENLKLRAVRRSTPCKRDIQTTLESHRIEAGKYLFLTETELKYLKVVYLCYLILPFFFFFFLFFLIRLLLIYSSFYYFLLFLFSSVLFLHSSSLVVINLFTSYHQVRLFIY